MGIIRLRSLGARWTLFAGLLFLFDSSCAKIVPVPEGDYKTTNPARDETYRLTTRENRIYEFESFAVTDSTLIILEVKSYGRNPSLYDMSKIKTPVVIPWDDVKSLERFEYSNLMTVLAVAGGVTAAGVILSGLLLAAMFAAAFRGMN